MFLTLVMGGVCPTSHGTEVIEPVRPLPSDDIYQALETCGFQASARAACFEAGGFSSFSIYSGAIAGLLWAYGQAKHLSAPSTGRPNQKITLTKSGLFNRFGKMSSSGGGSWFLAELIYSSVFREMVEDMAAHPQGAEELCRDRWMWPWLETFAADNENFKMFVELCQYHDAALGPDLLMLGAYWQGRESWSSFTGTFLKATASLEPDLVLGSPVEDWAQGKLWLVCHSVATPSRKGKVDHATLWEDQTANNTDSFYHYAVIGAGETPKYIPARFGVTLGAPNDKAGSPVPYCSATALPPGASILWTSRSMETMSNQGQARSPPFGDFSGFVKDTGSMSLIYAVAASSASCGSVIVQDELAISSEYDWIRQALPIWATTTGGVDAFSKADSLVLPIYELAPEDVEVKQETLESLAREGLHALVGGAHTDPTGIANAVATGATEVVAFLCSGMDSVYALFNSDKGAKVQSDAALRQLDFRIFQETEEEARNQHKLHFRKAFLPPECQVVGSLEVGCIWATTAESEWLGIPAGRSVRIACYSVFLYPYPCDFVDYDAVEYGKYLLRAMAEVLYLSTHADNQDLMSRFLFDLEMLGVSRLGLGTR